MDVKSLLTAATLAATWHAQQTRKGSNREPYVNHLLDVAALIAAHVDEPSTDLLIAALLHDAIEDQGISPEEIEVRFGSRVLALVQEVSDDKTLPKAVRKQLQIEKTAHKSHDAKVLTLADKISNLTSLAQNLPADWDSLRLVEYVEWARKVVDQLRGTSAALEVRFDAAAAAAEQASRTLADVGSSSVKTSA